MRIGEMGVAVAPIRAGAPPTGVTLNGVWVGEDESGGRMHAAADGERRRAAGMPMGAGRGWPLAVLALLLEMLDIVRERDGGDGGRGVDFSRVAEWPSASGGSSHGKSCFLIVGEGVELFFVGGLGLAFVVGCVNAALSRLSSGSEDERKCAGIRSGKDMLSCAGHEM